jgi:hypothetical protein
MGMIVTLGMKVLDADSPSSGEAPMATAIGIGKMKGKSNFYPFL